MGTGWTMVWWPEFSDPTHHFMTSSVLEDSLLVTLTSVFENFIPAPSIIWGKRDWRYQEFSSTCPTATTSLFELWRISHLHAPTSSPSCLLRFPVPMSCNRQRHYLSAINNNSKFR